MKQHPFHSDIWVTEDGRVFRELTPSKDGAGYHQIRNGKFRVRRHTLVCETFNGLGEPGQVVRHLDGNNADDSPKNLAWGSSGDNHADMIAHGRSRKGIKNAAAKITAAQVLDIKQRRLAGESLGSLAKEFGVSMTTVCDIAKGRTWGWL